MHSDDIYNLITSRLKEYAAVSHHKSDADEKDPQYKAYGVRMPEKRAILREIKPYIHNLAVEERIQLAERLIASEYGEEQSIAIEIFSQNIPYFSEGNIPLLKTYISYLHGWSKIDRFAGDFVQKLLFVYPDCIIPILKKWNRSPNYWERRASVVALTRRAGKLGNYTDLAIELCNNLIHDEEDMVKKGVGWSLKDNLRGNREKILQYIRSLRKQKVSSTIILYAIRDLSHTEREDVLKIR